MAKKKKATAKIQSTTRFATKQSATLVVPAGSADNDIETLPMQTYTEQAYLNYSMYVILDRALPYIGDGLKPVQRRIIYAMSELSLSAAAKYKKSARTIGDVLGKFHPHGDVACYEAMVLMAQSFSYRYPLVDGQGNWGSSDDPKSFAAMRYTEAKLSGFAELLLAELGQGTVDWEPNFDGTLQEPCSLPARLPNILLNGTTGIAVGMATDVLPHNLVEIADACIYLLKNPKASVADLCQIVKGPDFPTYAEIITPIEDIQNIYQTGIGSIKMRSKYELEDGDVVITALPYQTSGNKILEQIAAQMNAKKLPLVEDIRDESDHEHPTRIVIVPRSNKVDKEEMMLHLFSTTDLERNFRFNLNIIGTNGRPEVKNLKGLLAEWLLFRTATVTRRLQYRLEKVLDRLHLLDGFLIAYLNIDEIIAIIRREDKPNPALMQRFKLSERQADAILDLRLRKLAKLEEFKIRSERDGLRKERQELEQILGSKKRLTTLIIAELRADRDKFGDARRSPIATRTLAKAIDINSLTPAEPITVILSQRGWVRAAKGHEVDPASLSYKAGDGFQASACGKSNQLVTFLDSTGRSYSISAHSLPSARSNGEPLSGRVSAPSGAEFVGVMMGESSQQYLVASDAGYGFIVRLEQIQTKTKAGKVLLNLPDGARPLPPLPLQDKDSDWVALVSNEGRMLLFPVVELQEMGRGKGVKMLNIAPSLVASRSEYVVSAVIMAGDSTDLLVVAGQRLRHFKESDLEYYYGERGKRGRKLPRGFQKVTGLKLKE